MQAAVCGAFRKGHKIMLRTLLWVVWLFLYLIAYWPASMKAKRLAKKGDTEKHREYVSKKIRRWSTVLFKNLKINLTVKGREYLPKDGEAVVFVSNHQSYIDIPATFIALDYPRPIVAKEELHKIPFLRSWMDALGCLYLDREDMRSAGKLMREVEKLLKSGQSIIIYPEGTRSKSDEIGEFKSGAVHMAIKAGVPIVPVVVDGIYKVLEGNNYRLQPADARVEFLPPISVEGLSRAEQKALPARLEGIIREGKDKGRISSSEENKES